MTLLLAEPTASLDDFAEFARRHVASMDIDPVYPVLAYLMEGADEEFALAHTFLYVAYYDLGSAETAWMEHGADFAAIAADERLIRLPTGVERRAHRSPAKLRKHLLALAALHDDGIERRLYPSHPDPKRAWADLVDGIAAIYGNGRWASYKTAEILWKVHGWPVEAPDMGNDGSSGPLKTLSRFAEFYGLVEADAAAEELRARLATYGVELAIEELETVLCDFGSMMKGSYYVGHDIDLMLEQARRSSTDPMAEERIMEARHATLPAAYLGEVQGWRGTDRWLARRYLADGTIGDRAA